VKTMTHGVSGWGHNRGNCFTCVHIGKIFAKSSAEPLCQKSWNLHESFLTLCKSKFVKIMAVEGEGVIRGETVFTCVYMGNIFLSPRTISSEMDVTSLCAWIIVSVIVYGLTPPKNGGKFTFRGSYFHLLILPSWPPIFNNNVYPS
jgi:hypothetical protein